MLSDSESIQLHSTLCGTDIRKTMQVCGRIYISYLALLIIASYLIHFAIKPSFRLTLQQWLVFTGLLNIIQFLFSIWLIFGYCSYVMLDATYAAFINSVLNAYNIYCWQIIFGVRRNLKYFTVRVGKVVLQKTNTKKYHAYKIRIIPTQGGDEWAVLRRYSEFYRLHRTYQKDNHLVQTLDFPPKKVFGNMEAQFVEQRRQQLQVYLRNLMIILTEVASCTTKSQLETEFPFLKES